MPWSGSLPDLRGALGLRLHDRPQAARDPLAAAGVQQNRVEHRAEDVVLALVERAVADPHGPRARVPAQVVAGRLGQVPPAVDPVHDLERSVLVGLQVGDELHELVRLPVEVQEVERLEREGRVAHPGEAVVPVALSARCLRERRRQRRDRRPGWHVGEALDRQRGALDRLAEAVVGQARAAQPPAPVTGGRAQPLQSLVGGLRPAQVFGPRQRAEQLLALLERVPRTRPVALDADRHVGVEPDRQSCTGGVHHVAVAIHERPLCRGAAVVEYRLANELHVHLPIKAQDRSHEHVVAVVVRGRPGVRSDRVLSPRGSHGQRVADHDPSGRRLPGRQERVGARLVQTRRRVVDAERGQLEGACLAIEKRSENAGGVEARNAQPVHGSVWRDQCARMAVRQEGVLGDRREGRRSRGALRHRVGGGLLRSVGHEPVQGPCQPP